MTLVKAGAVPGPRELRDHFEIAHATLHFGRAKIPHPCTEALDCAGCYHGSIALVTFGLPMLWVCRSRLPSFLMGLLMPCALAWPELVHRRAHSSPSAAGVEHPDGSSNEHSFREGASSVGQHPSAGDHPHLELKAAPAPKPGSLALPVPIGEPRPVSVASPVLLRHPPRPGVEPWRGPPPGPPLPSRSPPLA